MRVLLRDAIKNPLVAYIAPFAAFLGMTALEGIEQLRPYYPWVYSAKIAIASALWLFFSPQYPRFKRPGIALGVLVGAGGVVLWIALASLGLESRLAGAFPSLFGARVAYDPFQAIGSDTGRSIFLVIRLLGLAVTVPLIEEVFWRGFLMRYLVRDDFTSVPIGTYTLQSFALTTVLFAAVHPEILAALAWGGLVNWLVCRTGNLWAAIVAHAVTNLLLGLYILGFGAYWLW